MGRSMRPASTPMFSAKSTRVRAPTAIARTVTKRLVVTKREDGAQLSGLNLSLTLRSNPDGTDWDASVMIAKVS
jgi:hypothetical protein